MAAPAGAADAVDRDVVLSWTNKIPWDTYIGVGRSASSGEDVFLSAADVRAIRRFASDGSGAGSGMSELLATRDEDALRYPQALLKVLLNITDVRLIQYALTLAEDFLTGDSRSRAPLFHKPGGSPAGGPHMLPFLQLVGTGGSGAVISSLDANAYVLERAAACAALLLSADCRSPHATSSMLAWVMTHIRNFGAAGARQVKVTEVAVTALRVLLRNDLLRQLFVDEEGIQRLLPMLSARNTQMLYDAVVCLWTLALHAPTCAALERAGAVAGVARLARGALPLKVLRVSLAMLAAVAKQPDCADSLAEICESHVPETVDALLVQEPRVTDVELLDDLHFLKDAVRTNRRKLSSFERYERNLAARKFEWTVVHTSDFWKENAAAFEADGFALIARIRDLLKDTDGSVDETTQAVALFDLGEFAVQHPQGRTVLEGMGVRPVVMAMLKHEDDEVRQQALLATSKMLVTRWQFVSAPTAAAAAAAGGAAKAVKA